MVVDGASYHKSKDLVIGRNMTLIKQPPSCPELNPVENMWKYIRDNYFGNELFKDMDGVIDRLYYAYTDLHQNKKRVESISNYGWIRGLL